MFFTAATENILCNFQCSSRSEKTFEAHVSFYELFWEACVRNYQFVNTRKTAALRSTRRRPDIAMWTATWWIFRLNWTILQTSLCRFAFYLQRKIGRKSRYRLRMDTPVHIIKTVTSEQLPTLDVEEFVPMQWICTNSDTCRVHIILIVERSIRLDPCCKLVICPGKRWPAHLLRSLMWSSLIGNLISKSRPLFTWNIKL